MVRLYTSGKYFKDNEIIIDNDSFFNNNVSAKSLSENSIKVMEEVDHAKLLDHGITGIQDLSTGCKTILNCIFLQENQKVYPTVRAINATECGKNALEQLFCYIDKTNMDIGIVLEHEDEIYECGNREYLINDSERITDLLFMV